jgi:hypothetical protein
MILQSALVSAMVAMPASSQVITEDHKITPVGSPFPGNEFGLSSAVSGGKIFVGSPRWSGPGGAVYVYDAANGSLLGELESTTPVAGDRFGNSVAANGAYVVVGARQQDRAFVFNSSSFSVVSVLNSIDANGISLGSSVAIDDGLVVVGAENDSLVGTSSGSAYVFDAASGNQLHKLVPADGAELDQFGYAVAIDNGVVAVGAWNDDDNGNNSGSVYLFDAVTGLEITKLHPSDAQASARFGCSVAMDNGLLLVGAYLHAVSGLEDGSAYIFDVSTLVQQAKLTNSLAKSFGWSVSIDDGVAAVGARTTDGSGTAYLFDTATGDEIVELNPTDPSAGYGFGWSIAIDNGDVAVGASGGSQPGFAYKFTAPQPCLADTNHDGMVTPTDFTAWIAAFNSGAPECDQNGDGMCTPTDFTAWIANFNAGC